MTDVDAGRVQALAQEKDVDLERDLRTPRRNLYRKFLEHCLNDHALSEDESASLAHLQKLLCLQTPEVRAVHDEITRAIYGQAMKTVLEDYRLDPEEEEFLRRLQADIGVSEEAAAEIRREGTEEVRHRFVSSTIVHKGSIVASQGAEIELEGSSEAGLQGAIEAAIATVPESVGPIERAELKSLRVDVTQGGVARWEVTLVSKV